MIVRTASCRCGQLSAACAGEPVRISVCHCLDCQRRTGSAFAAQARWPEEQVVLSGSWTAWQRKADSGSVVSYRFCGECGSTIAYSIDTAPGIIAIPLGAFADPDFPGPRFSVYEERKHGWVEILGSEVEHSF